MISNQKDFIIPLFNLLQNTFFAPEAYSENESDDRTMKDGSASNSKPLRIMLADDDADDRDLFAEAVAESGLHTSLSFAEDGIRLLEMLTANENFPDVIFLDLNMPNKTGKECLIAIRKNNKLRNIPVVIYSTSSSQKDIDDTWENGANLYIRKPSSFKEMMEIAAKVLALDWDDYKPNSTKSNFVFTLKS